MTIPAVSKSDEGLYKCTNSEGESPESWMTVKTVTEKSPGDDPVYSAVKTSNTTVTLFIRTSSWVEKDALFSCGE
ncbi:hypothetical protein J4Q44_G00373610 [Coregonus suidteri]|uniref:Uncharacterized protein n=1 Tax=Coregonus suidteri TaxID=861788 RepID=A0AAN8QJE2_9TELE